VTQPKVGSNGEREVNNPQDLSRVAGTLQFLGLSTKGKKTVRHAKGIGLWCFPAIREPKYTSAMSAGINFGGEASNLQLEGRDPEKGFQR